MEGRPRGIGSGFDPEVFRPLFQDAGPGLGALRWWYRKFYEETKNGQMTQLCEYVEFCHYTPEWKHRQILTATIEQVVRNTAKLERLFIFVLIALGLILLRLWR